ncbi:MAG: protein kinase [Kofleriaceae bacterium]|nr:protein kinase [Kofleriaceae bacterium]
MGEVFEAFDRDRGDVLAIKTLTRTDGETFARFKREFRALQSTSHPNLVSIRELVCADDVWFFTMELVDGRHFLEHVRGDNDKLRATLEQLVVGLTALHEAGFVHRDVKPSNVMVTRDGRVVLLDFGLVTNLDPQRQSIAHGPIGTVEYMAPEQASGLQVGEAADWYGVGVMLYEALTGKMPHSGHALQIMVQKQQVEPKAATELAPDAPRDLCDLCMSLLAIEPSARPTGTAIAKRLGIDLGKARRTSTPMTRTLFVGRERELAELAASATAAKARVHLVVGESGIGKSELVSRFVRTIAAEDPDAMTLAGRCYERESVPFKAFDGVADGLAQLLAKLPEAEVRELLPERPALLSRLFPVFQLVEAIATAPESGIEAGEPHEQRRRMFVALRELFTRVARKRRVAITIDDLQWADADSFLLLRELLRGGDAPPLLVLATARVEDAALEDHLDGLSVGRTNLGPLSEAECHELAEGLVPGATARFDLDRVSREAGGHPMFLHEILRHLDVTGGGEAGATLDDALSARIALLQPAARTILEVVCLAGAPISLEVAAKASRLDATTVSRAVASLRVAMLVRETQRGRYIALEPYHDRVRETVDGRIEAAPRKELHARIAYALETAPEGRDQQLLLRNFLLAELSERAARYAEDAAHRSEAAHAFDQAAELWRVALDAIPRDADDRRRVLMRLGHALIDAGRGTEAAEHYLAAAEGADRATLLECHRHAAEQLLISGHIGPGMEVLQGILEEIGVPWPKTLRATLASLLWNRVQVRVRGLGFRERHRREISDATMLELEVLKSAAAGLAMIDSLRGMDFQTRHLRKALATGHRAHITRALLIESMFHATASNRKRALQYIQRALEVGNPEDAYLRAMVEGARGALGYFSGDIVTAVKHLEEATQLFPLAPGNNWERSTSQLFLLFAQRFAGDFAAIRAKYEDYKTDARNRGDRYLDSTMRRACASMWLAEDDPRGAVRELVRATWVPPTDRFHVQHFHELVAWAEIGLYHGVLDDRAQLPDRIAKLRASLLTRVESVRVLFDYTRGRLALAGHLPESELPQAIRGLHKEKNPLAAVWSTLLEAGDCAKTDATRAATLYERAAELAHVGGMRSTAAASRWRLAQLRDDAALKSTADGQLAALGVRRAERMCGLIAPIR